MTYLGIFLLISSFCLSLYSCWRLFTLNNCIERKEGDYSIGYEFTIRSSMHDAEEYLLRELKKADLYFDKKLLSVFQFLSWTLSIPLILNQDKTGFVLAVWPLFVICGCCLFSQVKRGTVDMCYLVLRQYQENKILDDSKLSDSRKVYELTFLRGKK